MPSLWLIFFKKFKEVASYLVLHHHHLGCVHLVSKGKEERRALQLCAGAHEECAAAHQSCAAAHMVCAGAHGVCAGAHP